MSAINTVVAYRGNTEGDPSSGEPARFLRLKKQLPFTPKPGMTLVAWANGRNSEIVLDVDTVKQNDGVQYWEYPDKPSELHMSGDLQNSPTVESIDHIIDDFRACGWEVQEVDLRGKPLA